MNFADFEYYDKYTESILNSYYYCFDYAEKVFLGVLFHIHISKDISNFYQRFSENKPYKYPLLSEISAYFEGLNLTKNDLIPSKRGNNQVIWYILKLKYLCWFSFKFRRSTNCLIENPLEKILLNYFPYIWNDAQITIVRSSKMMKTRINFGG